jgi:addiction module RelE/StbE family toxin
VIWTSQARADRKVVHDYIAKDSKPNAKEVVQDMRTKADALADLPRMGKVVPEVEHDDLREIGVHSWRIIYHLRRDNIYVIAVVHKRRLLDPDDLLL